MRPGRGEVNGLVHRPYRPRVPPCPPPTGVRASVCPGALRHTPGRAPSQSPGPAAPAPQPPTREGQDAALRPQDLALFRCEGDYWTGSCAGTTCLLKDACGLHDIATLLQHPQQAFYVITLGAVEALAG
jgi:hypothetical protein